MHKCRKDDIVEGGGTALTRPKLTLFIPPLLSVVKTVKEASVVFPSFIDETHLSKAKFTQRNHMNSL